MTSQDETGFDFQPELPLAISSVGGRYLLFDIKIATYLRRRHNICGLTIGSLPLAPSQNIFLGIPIELMPEEAQLLVENGTAIIVDDARAHDQAIQSADKARRADYLARIQQQSKRVEEIKAHEKVESRKRGLEKQAKKSPRPERLTKPETAQHSIDFLDMENGSDGQQTQASSQQDKLASIGELPVEPEASPSQVPSKTILPNSFQVTPTTSQLLLPTPSPTSTIIVPAVKDLPSSYPLYRYLHEKGYFLTPGLRFGCQYTVYPGDPLRFHSHFLAVGTEWDDDIDLVDIVGGGRLGTGVKKGFLLGGQNPTTGDVRSFSVEWAAM